MVSAQGEHAPGGGDGGEYERCCDRAHGLFCIPNDDQYIGAKVGLAPGDEEYKKIMIELWKRVKETHRTRIVK
jgi:hypothetical protein